jgi:hypothetical protein
LPCKPDEPVNRRPAANASRKPAAYPGIRSNALSALVAMMFVPAHCHYAEANDGEQQAAQAKPLYPCGDSEESQATPVPEKYETTNKRKPAMAIAAATAIVGTRGFIGYPL